MKLSLFIFIYNENKHLMNKRKPKKEFKLRGRFWIEGPNGTFLGRGRVRLLESIRDCGSISAAARAMKMSYRRAWDLVDSMNNQCSSPVVKKSTGGKGGGGAILTEKGEEVIRVFWSAHLEFEKYIDMKNQSLSL